MSDEKLLGVYPDMNEDEYHEHEALGSTDCKYILQKEAIYKYRKENPEERSSAMVLGTAAHCFLLQRDKFDSTFHLIECDNKLQKAWKDGKKEAEELGKIPLAKKEYEQIIFMGAELSKHKFATRLMQNGTFEESHFAVDPETGAYVKARPDFRGDDETYGHYIIDYKTTKVPLNRQAYTRQFGNMEGQIHAAHYKRTVVLATGKEVVNFFHLVQMSKAPFLVRLYRVTDEWAIDGDSRRVAAWNKYAQCCEANYFPGYERELFTDLGEIPAFINFGEEG